MKVTSAVKNFYIITYDIIEDRVRNRILKAMKGVGYHVQKSVFECHLDEEQINHIKNRLLKEIDEEKDSIRIYRIRHEGDIHVEILGLGEVPEEKQLTII